MRQHRDGLVVLRDRAAQLDQAPPREQHVGRCLGRCSGQAWGIVKSFGGMDSLMSSPSWRQVPPLLLP